MFESLTIDMNSPICSCFDEKKNINWGIGDIELLIRCDTCGAKLTIPHNKLIAVIKWKQPYPQKQEEVKE